MIATPLEPTGDGDKVLFKDERTGLSFVVKVSGTLFSEWRISEADERVNAIIRIGETIKHSHSEGSAYKEEYTFTTDNSETSLDRHIDWLVRNKL